MKICYCRGTVVTRGDMCVIIASSIWWTDGTTFPNLMLALPQRCLETRSQAVLFLRWASFDKRSFNTHSTLVA